MKDAAAAARSRQVRPRVVWIGLFLALTGMVTLAVGIADRSAAVSVCGLSALGAGVVVGVRGGALYDAVSVLSLTRELRQATGGGSHQGVAAGDMVQRPKAQARAAEAATTSRVLLKSSERTHAASWARIAGGTLLLTTVTAVLTQWTWVAHTATGHNSSARDGVLLVVTGLGGIRLGVVPGRHRMACSIVMAAGLCLMMSALFAPHDGPGAADVEMLSGAISVAAGFLGLVSPWLPSAKEDCPRRRS